MPNCKNCGAELEGKFCSSCGTPNAEASVAQASQPAPLQTPPPVPQPVQQPQRFNPPPTPVYNHVSVIQQNKVTSTGGWIGWLFLLTLLPILGDIIMLICSNDDSAKNFVKARLLLVLLGLVVLLLLIILAAGGAAGM